jgi:hypothetical protein
MFGSVGRVACALACIAVVSAFDAIACEPVTGAPAKLDAGVYCLAADIDVYLDAEAGETTAFKVGDDATLDCKGHRIIDRSSALRAVLLGSNSAVRNCVIEGFVTAVGASHDYFRIERNTFRGSRHRAIETSGRQGLIARNLVFEPVLGAGGGGLIKTMNLVDIVGNTIRGPPDRPDLLDGAAYGISTWYNDGGVVARNTIRNPSPDQAGTAISLIQGAPVVYRNVMITAVEGGASLTCESAGMYLLNVAVGFVHGCGN